MKELARTFGLAALAARGYSREVETLVRTVDLADERGDLVHADAALVVVDVGAGEVGGAIEERALGAEDGAEGEVDVVAEAGLAFAGEDGVLLRAAEDQASGDVEDAHAGQRIRARSATGVRSLPMLLDDSAPTLGAHLPGQPRYVIATGGTARLMRPTTPHPRAPGGKRSRDNPERHVQKPPDPTPDVRRLPHHGFHAALPTRVDHGRQLCHRTSTQHDRAVLDAHEVRPGLVRAVGCYADAKVPAQAKQEHNEQNQVRSQRGPPPAST